jgi:hypothetical protein
VNANQFANSKRQEETKKKIENREETNFCLIAWQRDAEKLKKKEKSERTQTSARGLWPAFTQSTHQQFIWKLVKLRDSCQIR